MKIGRNAPCHCGSGKKYKFCHAKKDATQNDWSKAGMIAVAAMLVLGLVIFAVTLINAEDVAADGRVWSAEHGHWHNADGSELGAAPQAAPSGTPPPGKVWSAEHGHWHDAE